MLFFHILLTSNFDICYTFLVPKKTKKEKIIAELRRKLETVEVKHENMEHRTWNIEHKDKNLDKIDSGGDFSLPTINNTQPKNQASSVQFPTSYIFHDLRKTFFLAGLAISFEFIVYWFTELGGSKFFLFAK